MKTDPRSLTYLKWFAFPVLAFFVVAIPLNLYFEPISGDLTRIGHWAERDYGWNQPQPSVAVHANGSAVQNPQILVLGDSFSHPNIWQSYLAESRNLEILSFQYQDVGCVDNWLRWVMEKHYSNVHTIIVETVERGFVPLFRNMNTCANSAPKTFELAEKQITPTRPQKGLLLDASYLIPTAGNSLRITMGEGKIVSGDVINTPLVTDRLFSNRKSSRLLYYSEDDLKLNWTEKDRLDAIGNLKRIQESLAQKGLRLVLIVVPDKSSAYRPYFASEASDAGYPDIFKQLAAEGVNNINLLSFFQKKAGETKDLYLPNDTHLSTQGYKLMALKIADEKF